MRLLHLDDDLRDVELVRASCAAVLGTECELVNADARSKFESLITRQLFDGIISDSGILDLTGLEALRLTRQHAMGTPFVFYCGTLPPAVRDILRTEEPDGIFSKDEPTDLSKALEFIRRLTNSR